MEEVFQGTKFSKPIYERAAHRLVDSGGGVFSHPVGMAVHDDGSYARGVLKPGHVFSIDPQLRVPEETLYYRYEDVVVITENGYENFTDFLPTELDEIEKLVGRDGIVQRFRPRMNCSRPGANTTKKSRPQRGMPAHRNQEGTLTLYVITYSH